MNSIAYSDVKFYWQPNDYLPRVQVILVGGAQRRWTKILVKFWAPALSGSHDIRLLIDQPSLMDVFRELGPAVFLGIEDIIYSMDIFTWLDHEVQFRFFEEKKEVANLNLDFLFQRFPMIFGSAS